MFKLSNRKNTSNNYPTSQKKPPNHPVPVVDETLQKRPQSFYLTPTILKRLSATRNCFPALLMGIHKEHFILSVVSMAPNP